MSPEERDAFLAEQRTCRVATVGADGAPHVSALWFVWDGAALWLNSMVVSQRWTNLARDPRVSVLIDAGEVPRTVEPCEPLVVPEAMFGEKYAGGAFVPDGRHAWLKLVPEKVVSWD